MSTATIALPTNDEVFFRQRKAMLGYPVVILPFIAALFFLFGGGKGERHMAQNEAADKAGSGGFNTNMPNAKGGSMNGRDIEGPGFGKASGGQVLSVFTSLRKDSATAGLKPIAVSDPASAMPRASSLQAVTPIRSATPQSNAAAVAATGVTSRNKGGRGYQYKAPPSGPYYSASATDQQLESQLQAYERSRPVSGPPVSTGQARNEITSPQVLTNTSPATVLVSDHLTASRLDEPMNADNAFHTAPTGGSRPQPNRAVLSGGNAYGSKKTVVWLIPVVVHEDLAIKDGQQVKLRLLKEITADGITIPTNTILYAICHLSDDRLRLTVRSLQLGGQLIPLDLDVYDTDGSAGINVPGLSSGSQVGGQVRSSAIQGVQVPSVGGLANSVLNAARTGATNSVRQTTIRLRAGYNLFLKAQ